MLVGKVLAGSVIAAGVTAAMLGAGSASAAPGVSYDNGTGAVGIGDQEQDSVPSPRRMRATTLWR